MRSLKQSLGIALVAAGLIGGLPTQAADFKLKIGAGHPPVGLWVSTIKDV